VKLARMATRCDIPWRVADPPRDYKTRVSHKGTRAGHARWLLPNCCGELVAEPTDATGQSRGRTTTHLQPVLLNRVPLTLDVYRQIEDESVIDPDTCELRGKPVGTVNYHEADDRPSKEHLHVIWKKGNGLRRALVTRDWPAAGRYSSRIRRLTKQRQAAYGPLVRLVVLARAQRGHPPFADGVSMVVNIGGRRYTFSDYYLSRDILALSSSDESVRVAAGQRVCRERASLLEQQVTRATGTEIAAALPNKRELASLIH